MRKDTATFIIEVDNSEQVQDVLDYLDALAEYEEHGLPLENSTGYFGLPWPGFEGTRPVR